MNLNIHAGMRVLYKRDNVWTAANLPTGSAELNSKGLWIPIIPVDTDEMEYAEINSLFLDAFQINEWYKAYSDYFMTKEEYINFIESDEFDKQLENAYVSDGDYGYYPVSRYNRNWIEKQPFDYIVRGER